MRGTARGMLSGQGPIREGTLTFNFLAGLTFNDQVPLLQTLVTLGVDGLCGAEGRTTAAASRLTRERRSSLVLPLGQNGKYGRQ